MMEFDIMHTYIHIICISLCLWRRFFNIVDNLCIYVVGLFCVHVCVDSCIFFYLTWYFIFVLYV